MPDEHRPAYSRDSIAVRLPGSPRLDDLTPEWAWGGATGRGVRVAIIDSGVEADHPDLEGCVDTDNGVAITLDEHGEVVEMRGSHDDAFGHGTACSGIVHSLAPEATHHERQGARRGPDRQGRRVPARPGVGRRAGLRRDQPVARYDEA